MGTEAAMNTSNPAKAEVLRRIRKANDKSADADSAEAAWSNISREYRRRSALEAEAVLDLLEDRLRDYDAHVVRTKRAEIAATVAKILTERCKRRVIVPSGITAEWLPVGFEFVTDEGMSAANLDSFDGVLTGSTVAIAQTGTVILQNVAGQGRRAVTLVPDYHLCIVQGPDVVETVPEAMDRLHPTATRTTTFVSGPSATADIEMTRIKGVHGPRYLDVILVC